MGATNMALAAVGYFVGFPIGWKMFEYFISRAYRYRTIPAHMLFERIFCGAAWAGVTAFAFMAGGSALFGKP